MHAPSKTLANTLIVGAVLVLSGVVAWLTARPIDLVTADLGRHIANGYWLWHEGRTALLSQNFYSYTEPQAAFTNHHWLGGVLFYAVHQLAGFAGLSWLWLVLVAVSYALMAGMALTQYKSWRTWLVLLLAVPLASSRTEVRPEGFSVFFAAVFIFFLSRYTAGVGHRRWLLLLPLIMALWVNLHIYFVFGLAIIGFYAMQAWLQRPALRETGRMAQTRWLLFVAAASLMATMLNPFGLGLVLYPLKIFSNYGYMIVENQSLRFLLNYGLRLPVFPPALVALALLALGGLLALARGRDVRVLLRADVAIAGLFAVLASLALRNVAAFGVLGLPALASLWQASKSHHRALGAVRDVTLVSLVTLGLGGFWLWGGRGQIAQAGVGLQPDVNSAAEFFRQVGIKGPIFNNYDIGGYLIYHLFPSEPVFVDNRPEAYSESFLQDQYIKMQNDDATWRREAERYGLNTIFFFWHDATPHGQRFLTTRVQDPEWVPVFVDARCLILVKNIAQNQSIIERFAIPRETFRVR